MTTQKFRLVAYLEPQVEQQIKIEAESRKCGLSQIVNESLRKRYDLDV